MKKMISKCNIQKMAVALCFFVLCLGTQQIQTQAWNSGRIEFFRDIPGVLLAIIILTHYKWSDFVQNRIPYLVWTVAGVAGMMIGVPAAFARRADYLAADTVVIALGIFLMGYCILHTAIDFCVKKYRPTFYKPLLLLWLAMMLWMIFSETEYVWPECYFVLFLCYYLTEQTTQQRRNVAAGMADGIILGFLVIQGHSLLCRPYEIPRYVGNFCNPNNNSLFLCICLAAILAKALMGAKEGCPKWQQALCYLLAAVCDSFLFMTGSRSGYLAAAAVTVFFLLGYCRIRKKTVFVRMGGLLVALFLAMMPLTYLAVRYVPTIHPHVVFYYQEGYSESRVHSWDARDSEKYVSFEQMLTSVLGRFTDFFKNMGRGRNAQADADDREILLASNTEYLPVLLLTAAGETPMPEENPDKIPILTPEEATEAFLVRYTIYKWYFTHLSLRGMPYDEQGFQLTDGYWIGHPHNIYLDYGINFGWPAMLMFAVFVWWGIGRLTGLGWKNRDAETFTCLLVALVPPIFGMFEFAWGTGMLSTVAFYFVFRGMVCRDGTPDCMEVNDKVQKEEAMCGIRSE